MHVEGGVQFGARHARRVMHGAVGRVHGERARLQPRQQGQRGAGGGGNAR